MPLTWAGPLQVTAVPHAKLTRHCPRAVIAWAVYSREINVAVYSREINVDKCKSGTYILWDYLSVIKLLQLI